MATALDKQTSDKVSFITFIIPAFADAYKMNVRDAYFYLKKYGETAFTRDVCKIKHFDGSAPAPLAGNLRDASGGAEELDPPRHRQEHTAPPELNV